LFWKLNFPVCLRAFTVTFEWLKEWRLSAR
jgi:hypothetical protein